ncbi:MAG: hypothetical protein A3J79_04630 [Elusimicrobia bacterium RIFOXYB2_FULL_62_6]|nr:MAG: hypothetical protein A3J79_04630 [Elusimicrobia bacterium RIFOXYB2_FULL_62_6]
MNLFSLSGPVFSFDPLSVFFLFVILLIAVPAAFYTAGYQKGLYSPAKTKLSWLLFALFILSMLLVVAVNNVLLFLISWELMSLVSYFLVTFDSEHDKSVTAGTIYIIMTHAGTAFLIAAFLIMYKYAGSFDFDAVKAACLIMPPGVRNTLFCFFLVGFGTKAGIVPLHIWLPYAHPAAPTPVSSLMSGVMIKTAIYGLLRFGFWMLGGGELWWGEAILVIAAVSCLVGVIYALMEHDIKKLLAYHSVENIGIILLGVGAAFLFLKLELYSLAALALAAGLYHLVNHAIFKALLFFGAGAVYKATGTRNIEKLGGLIKLMPVTAFCFLAGSMAISALPPLNGFVSEWLTFQALFSGMLKMTAGLKVFLMLAAAALALTSGLAAACFVKAFAMVFLARPRSKKAEAAAECPASMRNPMLFLAALTAVFGLGAPFIFPVLQQVAVSLLPVTAAGPVPFSPFTLAIPQAGGTASASPLLLALLLTAIAGAAAAALYFIYGRNKVTEGETWGCGYYSLDAGTEYTATGFSKPFRIAFSFFLQPYHKTEKIYDSPYRLSSYRYETHTTPVFSAYFYKPLLFLLYSGARKVRKIQPGSINIYIAYIFAAALFLLLFMEKF